MGHKKKGKRQTNDSPAGSDAGEDRWDSSSLTSENSLDNNSHQQIETEFEDVIEKLSEKRASVREGALEQLIKLLGTTYTRGFLETRKDTLATYLSSSLRRGGDAEVAFACRVAGMASVTLGFDCDSFYRQVSPHFESIARNHAVDSVRVAALDALGISCWVNPEMDSAASVSVMERLERFFTMLRPSVQRAAINAWGLLATTLPRSLIMQTIMKPSLRLFKQLLLDDDSRVRIAAGENIGLLNEFRHDAPDGEEAAQSSGEEDVELDMDRVSDLINNLATDSDRRQSRKERSMHRASFKQISSSIDQLSCPTVALKLHNSSVTFSGWQHVKQLNALRDLLGSGFQVHLLQNESLRDIFDLGPPVLDVQKQRLSALEKRMLMSPSSEASKARAVELRKRRNSVSSRRMDTLLADEDQ